MTWQKCPICSGSGRITECAYGGITVTSESGCPTCQGQRIIHSVTGCPPCALSPLPDWPKKTKDDIAQKAFERWKLENPEYAEMMKNKKQKFDILYDPALHPNKAELRCPQTGKLLGTIDNIDVVKQEKDWKDPLGISGPPRNRDYK